MRSALAPPVLVLTLASTLVPALAAAQDTAPVEFVRPNEAAAYSEVVRVGSTLYVSGTLGLIPGRGTLATGGIQPETRQALENIRASIARFGASMDDLVKCAVFLADIAEWAAMNEVYVTFFPRNRPARSALGVAGLPLDARVEIECIGEIGAGGEAHRLDFMANLAHHCEQAFTGALALEPPGDDMLTGTETLLVHFRDCHAREVRIPFHIEIEDDGTWDRSRTWYVIRHDDRLELRHDHRRPDGSEARRTWYGGFSVGAGSATRQDFLSPERTERAGVPVGWRIEIEPGVRYAYGTTYDGEYDWRVEFDLTRPVQRPVPLPWGHDRYPTRRPGPP